MMTSKRGRKGKGWRRKEWSRQSFLLRGVREGTIVAEGLGKGLGRGLVVEVEEEGDSEEGAFTEEQCRGPGLEEEPEAMR